MILRKRFAAMSAAMTMAVTGMAINSNAFTYQDSWSTAYVYGNASMTYPDTSTIYVSNHGYQVYCRSINGSTGRYIQIQYGNFTYNRSSTGYSGKLTASVNTPSITFTFTAVGSGFCNGSGDVGYY